MELWFFRFLFRSRFHGASSWELVDDEHSLSSSFAGALCGISDGSFAVGLDETLDLVE